MLVIHGTHETHAAPRQIEHYVAGLKSAGKEIDVLWYEGGHIGSQRVEHMAYMLDFAHRVIFKQPT